MRLASIFALFLSGSFAVADPVPEVNALLAKMRRAYVSVKSAKISSKTKIYGPDKSITVTSDVLFRPPLMLRVVSKGIPGVVGAEFRATSNGKRLYLEGLPGGSMSQPATIRTVETALPQFNLEVLCLWDHAKQLSTGPTGNMGHSTFALKKEMWNGRSWTVLEETAKQQNAFVRYFIDPKTSLIWRTVYMTLSGKSLRQEAWIEKLEINRALDPKAFVIPQPKTIKV